MFIWIPDLVWRSSAMAIEHSAHAKESEHHNTVRYFAHVRQGEGELVAHDLGEHLHSVARRAEECTRDFGGGDWAQVAGLWCDLRKYSAKFQLRIMSVSGYNPEAHLEGPVGQVDPSTPFSLSLTK